MSSQIPQTNLAERKSKHTPPRTGDRVSMRKWMLRTASAAGGAPTLPWIVSAATKHLLWRQARQLMFTLESLRRRRPSGCAQAFPFSLGPNNVNDIR